MLLLAGLLLSFFSFAQGGYDGVVVDKRDGQPIPGVFVVACSGSVQKAFAFTDDAGHFSIGVGEDAKIDCLRAGLLGYESQSVHTRENKRYYRIELEEKAFVLDASSVRVRPVDERGDTVSFLAGAFADGSERKLADLLKKVPGLEVTASGGILHDGAYINKFYVDGLDLMGARYGVVTNNLSADDIAEIEIYKHHQPIAALKDVATSNRSAVNIILKSDLNSWIISADGSAGYGTGPLFDAKAIVARFGKRNQSLLLTKGNNIGNDIIGEIQMQDYYGKTGAFLISDSGLDSDFSTRLSPMLGSLKLPRHYWFDNTSGIMSVNSLYKTGEHSNYRVSVNVAAERINEQSASSESVTLPDNSVWTISERDSGFDTKRYFSFDGTFENNASKRFFTDKLMLSGQWRSNQSSIDAYTHASQRYKLPSFKISNELMTVRKTGRSAVTFENNTSFVTNNHSAAYEVGDQQYIQHLNASDFVSDNKISGNLRIGKSEVKVLCGVDLGHVGREADLQGAMESSGSLSVVSASPYASLSTRFRAKNTTTSLSLPFKVNYYHCRTLPDALFASFNPRLDFKADLSSKTEFYATAFLRENRSGEESLLPVPIMLNYRNLSQEDSLASRRNAGIALNMSYKDYLKMLFGRITVQGLIGKNDKAASSFYSGNLTLSSYTDNPSIYSSWGVSGNLKKYFGIRTFTIEADASYQRYESEHSLQGVFTEYATDTFKAFVELNTNFVDWMSLSAKSSVDYILLSGVEESRVADYLLESRLTIFPVKRVKMEANASWLYEQTDNAIVSNPLLLDAEVAWKFPKFTLFASCRNILGADEYRRELVATYRRISSVRKLRGREFMAGFRLEF